MTEAATDDAALLAESLDLVAPRGDDLIAGFNCIFQRRHCDVRALFRADILAMIVYVAANYHHRDNLIPTLREAGARHVDYGALPEHYPIVGATLLECLARIAGDAWTPQFEGAWTRMYGFVSDAMLAGAETTGHTHRGCGCLEVNVEPLVE